MAFVYRYIDLDKKEVVYIGKVTQDGKDIGNYSDVETLTRRHKQHLRNDKEWCNKDLILQFMQMSAADADIYETYLISKYYATGQLFNKAKMWGISYIKLFNERYDWSTYGANTFSTAVELNQTIKEIIDRYFSWRDSWGIDQIEKMIHESVKDTFDEMRKYALYKDTLKIADWDTDGEFKRMGG